MIVQTRLKRRRVLSRVLALRDELHVLSDSTYRGRAVEAELALAKRWFGRHREGLVIVAWWLSC